MVAWRCWRSWYREASLLLGFSLISGCGPQPPATLTSSATIRLSGSAGVALDGVQQPGLFGDGAVVPSVFGVNAERVVGLEVQVLFDTHAGGRDAHGHALQFAQPHVAQLGATEPEIAEPVQGICVLQVRGRDEPSSGADWREYLDHQPEGIAFQVLVAAELPPLFGGYEFHRVVAPSVGLRRRSVARAMKSPAPNGTGPSLTAWHCLRRGDAIQVWLFGWAAICRVM